VPAESQPATRRPATRRPKKGRTGRDKKAGVKGKEGMASPNAVGGGRRDASRIPEFDAILQLDAIPELNTNRTKRREAGAGIGFDNNAHGARRLYTH
jgi:hypothetical protein